MSIEQQNISVYPESKSTVGSDARWTPMERVRSAWDALAARLLAPVDNSSIVTFRVIFGILMFWEVNRYFQYGWIDQIFVDPQFHFTYHGFGWVQPLPGMLMHAHFLILGLLALGIMIGLWYRIVMPLFFLGFTYVFLLDKAHFLNHLYLACLVSFLMIFVPANRAFSIDAMRRPEIRSNTAPTWALVLLVAQIGMVYFYGGLAKLNWDWLRGEPMRIWMAEEMQFPILGRWFTEEWMVYLVSYGGLLFDLLVVPALLWPRTRWFAVIALVLFHRFNAEMFSIGIFPMFGTLSVVLFLPPELPRKIANKITGKRERTVSRKRRAQPVAEEASGPETAVRFAARPTLERATVILVVVFLAIQILLPFRHWLYPGNTAWTDQGDRFAWRMMLVSKRGEITFDVYHPATGETWTVEPADYLTRRQHSLLVSQPDLILQFSHYLADLWRADGFDGVEVRAITSVSLNGREYFPIVDPTVDLAAEELTPFNAYWITSIEDMDRNAQPEEAPDSTVGG